MSIFKSISDTIAGVVKSHTPDPIEKTSILNLIDNNIVQLQTVVDTYRENEDLFKYIKTALLPNNGINKDNIRQGDLYRKYLVLLSPQARRLEDHNILQSLSTAASFVLADHQAIRKQFDTLFNQGTETSDIPIEQLKLSHAVLFGFFNLSTLLADWFCYFLGSIDGRHMPDSLHAPPYREKMLSDAHATVASFVNDVISRGASKSIIAVVHEVKTEGDVLIYTGAASLDTYANINDYPGAVHFILNPFRYFQPILWIHTQWTLWINERYRRNLMMRDWIANKVAVLRLDMQNMDQSAPEYKRLEDVLHRYGNELSKYDKKIKEYEQG